MFYQPKERHAPRIVIAVVLGLAFFLAWGSLYLHLMAFSDAPAVNLMAQRVALTVSYLGVMAFAVFFARLIVPLRTATTFPFLALAVVGAFLGGYSYLVPGFSLAIGVVGTLFIGIENGWLLLLWSEFFGYVDSRCAGFSFAIAFAIAAVLYFAACVLPHLAQVLIASCLPIASTLVIIYGAKALSSGTAAGEVTRRRNKPDGVSVRYPWRTSELFGLLRYSFATTGVFAVIFVTAAMYFGGLNREVAGFGIVGVALLLAFMFFAKRVTMKRLYRISQPLMGLGLVLLPIDAEIGMTIIGCAYSLILYLLMLTLCEVANRFKTSVVRLTGFAFGTNLFACMLGELIGIIAKVTGLLSLVNASSLSIVCLVIFMTYTACAREDGGFIFDFSYDIGSNTKKVGDATEGPHDPTLRQIVEEQGKDQYDPRNMETSVVVFREAVNQRCALVAEQFGLSAREEEVLDIIMQGGSLQEVADRMFISTGTVKTHINHIYKKTGTQSRTELKGLIYPE